VTEGTPFILNNAIRESNVGAWKDGLFDCCRLGPCHPTLLHSVFCPQILMAQGLTRLKLNWLGERAPDHEWKRTFVNVCWIVAFYWILTTLLSPYNGNEAAPWFQWTFYRLIGWAFTIYTWVVLTRLRRSVRLVFEIPVRYKYLGQLEDFCIAFWCGCCAVSQMARQTCDYDEHSGACFSVTGVASSSDPIATWTV
jgi:Cys-rich protein (TIGR01571 family)